MITKLERARPTPALIVALVALVAAMSGAALALPGKDTVSAGDIKNDAVRSKHIKGKAIKGSDVQRDALKGKQILEDKLEAVPEAKTVRTVNLFGDSFERVSATDGVDQPSAQAAAPRVALASKGQLSIYAKCFRNATTDVLHGRIYVETSADGAIFESTLDQLEGVPFLNVGTGEDDRELLGVSITGPGAAIDRGDWYAMSPDGTGLGGRAAIAAKNGALAGGNGIYGSANTCLFGGDAIG